MACSATFGKILLALILWTKIFDRYIKSFADYSGEGLFSSVFMLSLICIYWPYTMIFIWLHCIYNVVFYVYLQSKAGLCCFLYIGNHVYAVKLFVFAYVTEDCLRFYRSGRNFMLEGHAFIVDGRDFSFKFYQCLTI